MKFWWQNWVSSTTQEEEGVLARYKSLVSTKGELFEDGMVPLTPGDTEDVIRRRRKFSTIWMICFIVVVAFALNSIIFGRETMTIEGYFYMTLLLGAAVAGRMMFIRNFDRALKSSEKRVIRGVITRKQMVGQFYGNRQKGKKDGCYVEFSGQLMIQIMPEDYKKLSVGDIIQMEMLAGDLLMKRKFATLGKL